MIARDLGVKINLVDTIAANRIPNLTSDKLDIVIYSFSITAERAKTIAFTNTVYVDQPGLLATDDTSPQSLPDLSAKGRRHPSRPHEDIVLTNRPSRAPTSSATTTTLLPSRRCSPDRFRGIVTSGGLAKVFSQRNPNLKVQFTVATAPMALD